MFTELLLDVCVCGRRGAGGGVSCCDQESLLNVSPKCFSRPPVNSVAQLWDIGFWARAEPGTVRRDAGWFWHRWSRFLIGLNRSGTAPRAQVARFSLCCVEMKEVFNYILWLLDSYLLLTSDNDRSLRGAFRVPEPARMSLVLGDIVVRVVYSTVASTQWSNRQIRLKISYRWSNTVIVQHLYINYTLCVFFFFSFVIFSRGLRGLDLVTITSLLLRRGVGGSGGRSSGGQSHR